MEEVLDIFNTHIKNEPIKNRWKSVAFNGEHFVIPSVNTKRLISQNGYDWYKDPFKKTIYDENLSVEEFMALRRKQTW